MGIADTYARLRREIPEHVTIVAAAKTRTREELLEFIRAGGTDIGENYVQEAERIRRMLGDESSKVRWHMIGRLQTNKINKCLELFDCVQTVDSIEMASAIDLRASRIVGRIVPVYIEVNIGGEKTKSGIIPEFEAIRALAEGISRLEHVSLEGMMTMGPPSDDPDAVRGNFRKTRELFDRIAALGLPRVTMKVLSMGMSDSYRIAIDEGSTMVRLGTVLFGKREQA